MEHTTGSDGKNAAITHACANAKLKRRANAFWKQRVPSLRAMAMRRRRWKPSLRSRKSSPETIAAVFGSKRALLAEVINPDAFSTPSSSLSRNCARPRFVTVPLACSSDHPPGLRTTGKLIRIAADSQCCGPRTGGPRAAGRGKTASEPGSTDCFSAQRGALRHDLEAEEATDVLWTLTSYELYRMLVVERRWEPLRYETWLENLLIQNLLVSR